MKTSKSKKVKWPKNYVHSEVPLYGGDVFVFTKPEDLIQANHALGLDAPDTDCEGLCQYVEGDKGGVLYLVMTSEDIGVFSHEMLHVVQHIAGRADFSLDSEDPEPSAYLFGFLYAKLFRKLAKKGFELS